MTLVESREPHNVAASAAAAGEEGDDDLTAFIDDIVTGRNQESFEQLLGVNEPLIQMMMAGRTEEIQKVLKDKKPGDMSLEELTQSINNVHKVVKQDPDAFDVGELSESMSNLETLLGVEGKKALADSLHELARDLPPVVGAAGSSFAASVVPASTYPATAASTVTTGCTTSRRSPEDLKILVQLEGATTKRAFFVNPLATFHSFRKSVEKKLGKVYALCYTPAGMQEKVEVDDDEAFMLFLEQKGKLVLEALREEPDVVQHVPEFTVHDWHTQFYNGNIGSSRQLRPVDVRPSPHTTRAPPIVAATLTAGEDDMPDMAGASGVQPGEQYHNIATLPPPPSARSSGAGTLASFYRSHTHGLSTQRTLYSEPGAASDFGTSPRFDSTVASTSYGGFTTRSTGRQRF